MKIEQLLTEHKKGVKAVKYAKKPQPVVGPEALKKKAKAKTAPPKTELEKHNKLKTTLEYREKSSMRISDLVEADYTYTADDSGMSPEEQSRRAKLLGFQTPRTVTYKDTDGVEASFQHTVHGSLIDPNWSVNGQNYDEWVDKGMVAFRDPVSLKKNVAFHQTQLNTHLQQGNEREAKNHAYKVGAMSAHLQDAEQYQRVKDKVAQLDQGAGTGKKITPSGNKIQDLQNAILARDPKALPRYGADGKMGKETRAAMAKYPDIAKQFPGIKEGKEKLSAQEKFKRGVKRAGYDMDAGAKRIEDLLAKQKKEREDREKQEKDMKEAKQPEAPKPRNFVAKNAKTAGAGAHKDAKKASKEVRGQKHKNKEMAETAMGKVVDYKPGVSATIDTGPGMTTQLDLKKNPTSLTKDPATGKLKLMPGTAATAQPSATTQSTVKPGDQVEMPKTNTMAEDILRLAGLR